MSIDWKLWTKAPAQVELWQGVALVLNLNPDSLEPSPNQFARVGVVFRSDSFPNDTKRADFYTAIAHAKRFATDAGPIFVSRGHSPAGKDWARVSLYEVVALFVALKRPDIPSPLLQGLAALAPLVAMQVPQAHGPRSVPIATAAAVPFVRLTREKRANVLTHVIACAMDEAGTNSDAARIWIALERLANQEKPPAPLIGVNSGGVQYSDGGKKKTFTRKALGDRLRRARKRESAR